LSDDIDCRVLVVEDEAMIAMLLEDMLTDLGYEVAGIAHHLDDAMQAAKYADIEFAILDINLNGEASFSVAEILRARSIPFIFATGYGTAARRVDFSDTPVLEKPFNVKGLADAINLVRP
jgi:DNA-binding response OmpR family regulator